MRSPCCLCTNDSPLPQTPESLAGIARPQLGQHVAAARIIFIGRIVSHATRFVAYENMPFLVTHFLTQTHNELSCHKLLHLFQLHSECRITHYEMYFFISSCPLTWDLAPILEHRADYSVSLIFSQAVGLLERVISSSQGLYLNTGQHKHRKTRTHIKHPCPRRDSKTVHASDRSATATGHYEM
jgi:hypothetical protein